MKKLFLFLTVSLFSMGTWAETFSATDIVKSGGTTTNHVKCSSSQTETATKKVKNANQTVVYLDQQVDTCIFTKDNWIQVQTDENYYLGTTITVQGCADDNSAGNIAVLFWKGGYSSSTADSVAAIEAPSRASTTNDEFSITLPSNRFRTIRLYRRISYKDGVIGSECPGTSTYKYGAMKLSVQSITATATTLASTYTVTINPNGGTTSTEGWTLAAGNYTKSGIANNTPVTLPTMTKDENVFAGWKDNHDNTITSPITITKDTTLIAQWVSSSATKYTISYNAESLKGQSVSEYPTEYTEGVGIASFPALNDVKDFHFDGWSPASIAADAKGDKEITATWVAAYDVTFALGTDATGTAPTAFQKWEGAKFNLPGQGSMVAPTGKIFDGWMAGSVKYEADEEYTMGNAAVEFVAQWKAGATTIFHYRWTGSSTAPAKNDELTATGGTILVGSYGSNSLSTQSLSSYVDGTPDDMKVIATSSMKMIKFGANDPYMELSLTSGKFKTGDTIKICGHASIYISSSVTSDKPSGDLGTLATGGTSSNTPGVGYLVLPQVNNADAEFAHIYLSRLSGGSAYFAAIKIIRPAAESGPATALDNTADEAKAVKFFKDGQIFIEKNGHVYNVLGGRVK